ncbi:MAG: hypothetical protein KDK36_21145 [Leptospiraceae bacterium]|nr:hypothetical protein [Leptospiraceae bacterium]
MNILRVIIIFLIFTPIYSEEETKSKWSVSAGLSSGLLTKFTGNRDNYNQMVQRNFEDYYVLNNFPILDSGKSIYTYNISKRNYSKYDDPKRNFRISVGYYFFENWEFGVSFGTSSYRRYFVPISPIELGIYYGAFNDRNLEPLQLLNLAKKSGEIQFNNFNFHIIYIHKILAIECYYKLDIGYSSLYYRPDNKDMESQFITNSPLLSGGLGLKSPNYPYFIEFTATNYFIPSDYSLKPQNVFVTSYEHINEFSILFGLKGRLRNSN